MSRTKRVYDRGSRRRSKRKTNNDEIVEEVQTETDDPTEMEVGNTNHEVNEEDKKESEEDGDVGDDKVEEEEGKDETVEDMEGIKVEDEVKTGRRNKRKSLAGKEFETRFGESEILAAYVGEEEGEPYPYSFVSMKNDVTFGDKDMDIITIQWFETNEEGHLVLDDNEDEIGVGALICPVTIDVVEMSNGSYQVPEAVHAMIKAKLEKQLSDDYDPEAMDDDGPDYETRMRKKRRIKIKEEPKKRGRKKKVEDDDDEMEDLDFPEDDAVDGKKKKTPKKQKKTKPKAPKSKKATTTKKKKKELIPRDDVEKMDNPWYQKTGKIDSFNGDTHRASKEVIRSYLSKDTSIFQKLLKDDKIIADVFALQSCDVPKSLYQYAILNEDRKCLKTIVKETKSSKPRAQFPACSLVELSSGSHTSRYADRNRYAVGASRGGKEGNNAFTGDMHGGSYGKNKPYFQSGNIIELLETHDAISVDFLDHLDKELFDGNMIRWGIQYHSLVTSGHKELAQHVMKILLDRDDVGLNSLHVDTLGSGHTLDKFRSVSVVKKTDTSSSVRFCPVHCAASNGNPTYLQQLLEVSPEAINTLDSSEAGLLHYAAVGEKSDTLKWIIEGPGATLNRNAKMRLGQKTTPLIWAAKACRGDNIRVLCDLGSYDMAKDMFNTKDVSGLTAFHHVAKSYRKARIDTAKALIECGADPNIHGDARLFNKQTPLMICAAKGDLELLKVLVDGGGDLLLVDKLSRTLLMFSAKNGNIHIMTYLLEMGVSVDAVDSSDNTALHYACAYGWVDCVKLLLQVGAPINAKNSWSSTPLEIALKKGRFGCAVHLLKQDADVNVRDKNGISLFNSLVSSYIAHLSSNEKAPLPWAVKTIMERKDLDVTSVDTSGQTLLHYIAAGHASGTLLSDLIDDLLSRGIDPLVRDKEGQVPAAIALKNSNLLLCRRFLKHSSHKQATDSDDDNLIQLLMPNISNVDKSFFVDAFKELYMLDNDWMNSVDATGMIPLMKATQTVRSNWHQTKGRGKTTLEYLFQKFPEQTGFVRARLPLYREWNDEIIVNDTPNWSFGDEYASGSRTILHEVLQCPDVKWALKMCNIILKNMKGDDINIKTKEGKDAVAFAIDTFVHPLAPLAPTVKLFKLLHENGANMNGIMHPLFSSLCDAEKECLEVQFSASDKNLEDASRFVLHREQTSVRKLLTGPKKRASVCPINFTPRLHLLLKRGGDKKPDPKLLHALMKDCGLKPDIKDFNGNTALHLFRDLDYVKHLLMFSDVNALNGEGDTALILAVESTPLVQLLIENGADVDVLTKRGTALHAAVMKGNNEVVKLLLKTCDVNALDEDGRSALHYAVSEFAISKRETLNPIENQLLFAGANVNVIDKYGRTPVHYAFFPMKTDIKCTFPPTDMHRDPIDMLTTLTRYPELQLDVIDEDGRSILHYAASVGASICVLLLCEKCQTIIENRDLDGNTALALALLAKRADTSILLISKGSNLNVSVTRTSRRRQDGNIIKVKEEIFSSLEMSLQSKECESVARYIIAAGSLSMPTILAALFSTGNFQLAMNQIKSCPKVLLQGQDKNNGMTALHYLALSASFQNALEFAPALVDALLDCDISPSTKCNDGRTALHIASMNGHIDLCRHLISKHHVSVDVKDLSNNTPLTSIFSPTENVSYDLACMLADASEDPKAYVNANIDGTADKANDQKWKDMTDLESTLFGTRESKNYAKESYIESLTKPKEDKTESTTKKSTSYIISSTTLIESVKRKDSKLANALLSFGADGTKVDQNGRSALHHAVILGDVIMVSLILRWNSVPLNIIDKFGFSALSYSVLSAIKDLASNILDLLLQFGADPLVGSSLMFAVKANMQHIAEKMISCCSFIPQKPNPKKRRKSISLGGLVWTRYSEQNTVWSLARVVSRGSTYSLVPYKHCDSNEKGPSAITVEQQRSMAIQGVPESCISNLIADVDVAQSLEVAIITLLSGSNSQKDEMLAAYKGSEFSLLKSLPDTAKRNALISPLRVDNMIGYMEESVDTLAVGKVTKVHPNGKYGIKLLNGQILSQVNRTKMRPLRDQLQIESKPIRPTFSSDLVHALVRPIEYGSFENMELLKMLINAGAPAGENNTAGKTPLDLTRARSTIQKYLIEVTNSKKLPKSPMVPSLNTLREIVHFEEDADKERQALLDAESTNTEKIIPEIIEVIQDELNQDSTENSVLGDGEDFFDVALTKVDVMKGLFGKYVFYKMQIAHLPFKNTYVLLTNWGRIGEDGKYQLTPFSKKDECIKEFCKVFKSKTGNVWAERESFVKHPKKYRLVKRPKRRLKNPEKILGEALVENQPCSLPKSVADMFRSFLDIKALSTSYECSGIDDQALPFGQLTVSTIQAAEKKLKEIKVKIEAQSKVTDISDLRVAIEEVAKATSEFYELLPMGDDIVKPFENGDFRFGQAVNLIRLLRDLTITKQLLMGARYQQGNVNPIDYAYKSLQVDIKPLEVDSAERKCLLRYVENTCTHNDIIIEQIYALNDGKEACNITNKRLLFHGSGNPNMVGILKHGLLIAPPEAPRHGLAYGKGVYFADQFDKAFGYTSGIHYSESNQPRAFVFVAEVALGDSYHPSGSEYMEKAKEGTQSTHAYGGTGLDASFDMIMNNTGESIPLGKLQENKITKNQVEWKQGCRYWGSNLDSGESLKIEQLCQDPNTKFPLKVNIMHCTQEMEVTILEPDSQQAKMVQVQPDDDDDGNDDDDDQNQRGKVVGDFANLLNLSNNGSRREIPLFRNSNDGSRYYGGYPSEFIVYDTKQIRLKYLIEVTSKSWVKEQFLAQNQNLIE